MQLPVGATQDRTIRTVDEVSQWYRTNEKDAVEGVLAVVGFGFGGQGQNVGLVFVRLKPFEERRAKTLSAAAVARRALTAFAGHRDAMIFPMAPPAIQGMGNSNGFDVYVKDLEGAGHQRLMQARNLLLAAAAADPTLTAVRPNGQEDTPQYAIDIDQEKASALGLALGDVNTTLSTAWGSDYVNDFIDRGRVKPVYLQASAEFRRQPTDLDRWHVRNGSGEMVPFSAFASGRWTYGSPRLERYNGAAAVEIVGNSAPGVSTGTAMDTIDRLAATLDRKSTR